MIKKENIVTKRALISVSDKVRVPRLANDTIDSFEARIHEAEYKLYPEVLESLEVGRR